MSIRRQRNNQVRNEANTNALNDWVSTNLNNLQLLIVTKDTPEFGEKVLCCKRTPFSVFDIYNSRIPERNSVELQAAC